MSFSWVLETTPGHCWHDRHHPDRDFLPWACWSAYTTSTILDDGPDDGERGRCEDANPLDLYDIKCLSCNHIVDVHESVSWLNMVEPL